MPFSLDARPFRSLFFASSIHTYPEGKARLRPSRSSPGSRMRVHRSRIESTANSTSTAQVPVTRIIVQSIHSRPVHRTTPRTAALISKRFLLTLASGSPTKSARTKYVGTQHNKRLQTVMANWTRLVRFIAVETGKTHIGEPVDSTLDGECLPSHNLYALSSHLLLPSWA